MTEKRQRPPYLLGTLLAGTLFAGYLAAKHTGKPTEQAEPALPNSARSLLSEALEAVRLVVPLVTLYTEAIAAKARLAEAAPIAPPRPPPPPQPPLPPPLGWIQQQWVMTKAAANSWSDDYAPSMGAALSYYTLFSLAPLLIIVIAIAGLVFGQEAAQGAIVVQLRDILGQEGAVAVESLLKSAREPVHGVVATLVGIALLLVGATAVFAELQSALDRIWRVPEPIKESGIWPLLRTRLLSFGLVFGLGFLLIVSLVVSTALDVAGRWWAGWFVGWAEILQLANFSVSVGIFTLLFAMIFKTMPRARIPWRDVWTGAAVTAFLFAIGKSVIGLYLSRSSLASGFGAAGSLVVLIAWVYYSAQIFLFGAEYTWIYSNFRGSRAVEQAEKTAANPLQD